MDNTIEKVQNYVADMDINSIFVDMTENMLMEKPMNPHRFMVDYLMNKYLLVKGTSIVKEMKEYAKVKSMVDALSKEQTSIIASGQFPMIKRIMSRLNIEDNLMSTYHLSLLDEGEREET